MRWKLAIQEYNCTIDYIKGELNIVADGLSRLTDELPVTKETWAETYNEHTQSMANDLRTQDESNEPRNIRESHEQKGALMNDISAASRESVGKHGTVSQLPRTLVKQSNNKRARKVKMDQEVKDPMDSVELVRGLFDTSSVLSANDDLRRHEELRYKQPSSAEIEILSNTVFTPIEISRTERPSPVDETSSTMANEAMMVIGRSTLTDSQTPQEESYNDV